MPRPADSVCGPNRRFARPTEVEEKSCADVRGQVLPGQCRSGGNQLSGRSLEHDATAIVTGTRPQVDDPVGVHHHGLMMLDHDHDHDHDHRSAGIDKSIEQRE